MPSESPLRPNLIKGALAVYPTHTPGSQPSSVIVFQFNPESMRRTLAHRAPPAPAEAKTGTAKEDVLRVAGPPLETITMTVDMHAADQLDDPDDVLNAIAGQHGLHPALAVLELLMYPPTLNAQKIEQQAAQGTVQVSPADLPLVLLVWGKSRVVPVKLTSFSIGSMQRVSVETSWWYVRQSGGKPQRLFDGEAAMPRPPSVPGRRGRYTAP